MAFPLRVLKAKMRMLCSKTLDVINREEELVTRMVPEQIRVDINLTNSIIFPDYIE